MEEKLNDIRLSGIVRAVCISEERGTVKKNIKTGEFISDYGISGDAHAGKWHRQVSLLSYDRVKEFNEKGGNVKDGDFGENLLCEGIDFKILPVGTILKCNEVYLRITQIGKKCHSHCEIFKRTGDCIMPREGVFAEVLSGGVISEGDEMTVQNINGLTAAVVTLSDKASVGEREDLSGPLSAILLSKQGYLVKERIILPDDRAKIEDELVRLSDEQKVNLVITTGGTGFSKRDVTPEATLSVCDRNAPGIAEAIRAYSMQITKRAMLSRGASAIRKETLIVNLPGSKKAVNESLPYILPELMHGIKVLVGEDKECGGI